MERYPGECWVLLALERYFRNHEEQAPDFVARMWLGERYGGEHRFEGRTTQRHAMRVSMETLVDETADSKDGTQVTLQKDGKGRMYYRVGMEYAPKSLELGPAEHGFAVERSYEAVEEPDDVRRREDGTRVVEAGATTPGEYVVPPARAEEMYHPETFGRSGTARLVVEAD